MPPIRTQPHNQRPHSAAHPTRKIFDPWNSSATGHQRAENRLSGSTSWRDSRHTKLAAQFAGGHGGGRRLADTVGAGCEHFGTDGRKENGDWEKGAPGLREKGWQSVGEMMRRGGTPTTREKDILGGEDCGKRTSMLSKEKTEEDRTTPPASPTERKRKLFSSLTFYINGSTLPLVSDHRLKHLIAQHGGRVAIGLARRSVTHVVLGTPNGRHNAGGAAGAGGGLAAGKIEKEVRRVGGIGVKFVGVEWLLESIKAQKRLPEVRFAVVNTAGCRQRSVYGMFGGNTTTGEALADGNDLGHRELPLGEKKTDAARDNGASSRPR